MGYERPENSYSTLQGSVFHQLGHRGKGILGENDSRVTTLKAPGSMAEWLGRKGDTNGSIRGQNFPGIRPGMLSVLCLSSVRSFLSETDRGPVALGIVGLVV